MALHVERHGRGPDLVLLHGWGLHGGVWSALAARLAASFRLHVVDLPGHGRSLGAPLAGLDMLVDAVAEVTPAGAGICGWSLGGLVALRLAARRPAQVAALALVSTTPCFVRRHDWPHAMAPETLADFAQGLRTDAARTIRRFVNLNALGGPQARELTRELAALCLDRGEPSPAALAAGLAILRDTDLRADIGTVATPALVIHGGRDVLVPVGAGRRLAQALPMAQYVEIADAAHLPFVSHADRVAAALERLHG